MNMRHKAMKCMLLALTLTAVSIRVGLPDKPAPKASPLAGLEKTASIFIEDDWMGLSPAAPIEAHYVLYRGKKGFAGKAKFSVAKGRKPALAATESIAIPSPIVLKFLQTLAASPLKPGKYQPKIEHTDDYPSLRITLSSANGSIVFFSESQGEEHAPWGLKIKDEFYTVDSGVPARALNILRPYFKKKVLDRLEAQAQK
jgi:hypothetical protein